MKFNCFLILSVLLFIVLISSVLDVYSYLFSSRIFVLIFTVLGFIVLISSVLKFIVLISSVLEFNVLISSVLEFIVLISSVLDLLF